jgi:hypothetical protein
VNNFEGEKMKSVIRRIIVIIILALLATGAGCGGKPVSIPTGSASSYSLTVTDESGKIYNDIPTLVGPGVKVQSKTIRIKAETSRGEIPVYVAKTVDNNSVLLQKSNSGDYELVPGNNQLGVFVGAYPKGPETIDIKWINVYYKSSVPATVTLEPAALSGETGKLYSFAARTENSPAMASYEWKKDGVLVGKGGGNTLTTKFDAAGTYKISVTIYDTFFEENVGTAESIANIK